MKINNIKQKAQVLYKQGKAKAEALAQKTGDKVENLKQGARNLIYKSDLEKLQKEKAVLEKKIAQFEGKRILAKLLKNEKLVQRFEQKLNTAKRGYKDLSKRYDELLKKQSAAQDTFEAVNP